MNGAQSSNRIKIYSGFWKEFHLLGIFERDIVRAAKLQVTILIEPVVVTTAQYFYHEYKFFYLLAGIRISNHE